MADEKKVWGIHTQDDSLFLQGNVIAIGDPAFEWNKASEEAETTEIQNLYKLAKNTIDYLMKE